MIHQKNLFGGQKVNTATMHPPMCVCMICHASLKAFSQTVLLLFFIVVCSFIVCEPSWINVGDGYLFCLIRVAWQNKLWFKNIFWKLEGHVCWSAQKFSVLLHNSSPRPVAKQCQRRRLFGQSTPVHPACTTECLSRELCIMGNHANSPIKFVHYCTKLFH